MRSLSRMDTSAALLQFAKVLTLHPDSTDHLQSLLDAGWRIYAIRSVRTVDGEGYYDSLTHYLGHTDATAVIPRAVETRYY